MGNSRSKVSAEKISSSSNATASANSTVISFSSTAVSASTSAFITSVSSSTHISLAFSTRPGFVSAEHVSSSTSVTSTSNMVSSSSVSRSVQPVSKQQATPTTTLSSQSSSSASHSSVEFTQSASPPSPPSPTSSSASHSTSQTPNSSPHSSASIRINQNPSVPTSVSNTPLSAVHSSDSSSAHSSQSSLSASISDMNTVPFARVSSSGSAPGSTGHTSTITSTITPHPQSTFSTPVSITVTNSANGRVTLSTPPLVTRLSTSTEPDGSSMTITYVVANPTGVFSNSNKTVSSSSFFNNHGAVAGVFLVVGIVVAALAVCLGFIVRRRQNRSRRSRLRASIAWPRPLDYDPFENPRDPPAMANTSTTSAPLGSAPPGPAPPRPIPANNRHTRNATILNDEFANDWAPRAAQMHSPGASGFTGVGAATSYPMTYRGPFNDYVDSERQAEKPTEGLAITTDLIQLAPIQPRAASVAQSSPSLYPATLPMGDEDIDPFYEQEMGISPTRSNFPDTESTVHLSEHSHDPSKETVHQLLTPPASAVTSESPFFPSPIAEVPLEKLLDEDVNGETFKGQLKRVLSQTILDVRPRHYIDDNILNSV